MSLNERNQTVRASLPSAKLSNNFITNKSENKKPPLLRRNSSQEMMSFDEVNNRLPGVEEGEKEFSFEEPAIEPTYGHQSEEEEKSLINALSFNSATKETSRNDENQPPNGISSSTTQKLQSVPSHHRQSVNATPTETLPFQLPPETERIFKNPQYTDRTQPPDTGLTPVKSAAHFTKQNRRRKRSR